MRVKGRFFVILAYTAFLSFKVSAFDHNYKTYQEVLNSFVIKKGPQTLVKYKALKKDSQSLENFLSGLSKIDKKTYASWSQKQKLAFLINSYNAFTLKLIIDHYPVESIKDIGSFFSSPWKKKFFSLLGEKTNLDHIEHDLIRKNFKEPRIHFAVNCASMGCPSLARKPFVASKLDIQLEKASKEFILNRMRNRLDLKKKTLYLSKIFKWYGGDFKEMTATSYQSFVKKFLPDYEPTQQEVEWLDYDWSLNEAP